jgi:hypothetical protein
MKFGNIPKLLSSVALGALGTLASAQVPHANLLPEYFCIAGRAVGDEFVPHMVERMVPRDNGQESINSMQERCVESVDGFIKRNDVEGSGIPLGEIQPYFMQVNPQQAPEIPPPSWDNDPRNTILSI